MDRVDKYASIKRELDDLYAKDYALQYQSCGSKENRRIITKARNKIKRKLAEKLREIDTLLK